MFDSSLLIRGGGEGAEISWVGQSRKGEQTPGEVRGKLEGLFLQEQNQATKELNCLPSPSKTQITLEHCRGVGLGVAKEECPGGSKPLAVLRGSRRVNPGTHMWTHSHEPPVCPFHMTLTQFMLFLVHTHN